MLDQSVMGIKSAIDVMDGHPGMVTIINDLNMNLLLNLMAEITWHLALPLASFRRFTAQGIHSVKHTVPKLTTTETYFKVDHPNITSFLVHAEVFLCLPSSNLH